MVRQLSRESLRRLLASFTITATALVLWTSHGAAQVPVVGDNTLSLPDGPGSLEGIGENVSVEPHMGQLRQRVPIAVMPGFAGMTPDVSLNYSSGSGSSVVGLGWSVHQPSIERMTHRGLPEYTVDDHFAANGGEELVHLPDSSPATYRARFERGFVRYQWRDRGDGTEGYWTAEYPDGRIGYFGAGANGVSVETARAPGADGTFRYHLVEMTDVHDHRMVYTYESEGNRSYVTEIGYVFPGDDAQYTVEFEYGDREDELSDCKSGVNQRLLRRLDAIDIRNGGQLVRRYELTYDDYTDSGGLSRLVGVDQIGLNDSAYPIRFDFEYSRALGAICDGAACDGAILVDMGSLGVSQDITGGNIGLVDMNGDALPDVLNTSAQLDGGHEVHLNVLGSDGSQSFASAQASAQSESGGAQLSSPFVQILDTDGDGFADLVDALNDRVFQNLGAGDWSPPQSFEGSTFPDFENNANLRFLDYDGDKRIDVMMSATDSTQIYVNDGDGTFASAANLDTLGTAFSDNPLFLEDMNGDGLQDLVLTGEGFVEYRLNLGFGRFAAAVEMDDAPDELAELYRLVDINGDGLNDIVIVRSERVEAYLNRNAERYLDPIVVETASGDAVPELTEGTTILFADMNGNGSEDVVWIASGQVSYLELFPVRPNLLHRVENGIGMVTEITYQTAAHHRAVSREAENPWDHPLPHPMVVVAEVDTWTTLHDDVHEIRRVEYRDGYYDGEEKHFRGFARIRTSVTGDESVEAGLTRQVFDVGATDRYHQGLLLETHRVSDGRPIHQELSFYDDCPLDDSIDDDLEPFPIRHVCLIRQRTVHQEGSEASDWITVETRTEYDDYGNPTLRSDLGIVAIGAVECDDSCLGDERFTETTFASPDDNDGLWILRAPVRTRTYGVADNADDRFGEAHYYYDGDPFVGLAQGRLTRGLVTRMTRAVSADQTIDGARNAYDDDGNVVESYDPGGTVGDHSGHYTTASYSDDGLRLRERQVWLSDDEGDYQLRVEVSHDATFHQVAEVTSTMLVVDGDSVTPRNSSFRNYDDFGRVSSVVLPGDDTLNAPTYAFTYELSDPVSRVGIQSRSQSGEAPDIDSARCFDGRGRVVQNLSRLDGTTYLANGFSEFNVQGAQRRVFQPHTTSSGDCEEAAPNNVLAQEFFYDAVGRLTGTKLPDAAEFGGTASETHLEYGPLTTVLYESGDLDTSDADFDTPQTTRLDGLNRLVAVERLLSADGEPAVTALGYDDLGRLTEVVDADGNIKTQTFDLLDRVVEIADPNAGTLRFEYDDASNVVARSDERDLVWRTAYDGANRTIEMWDDADRDGSLVEFNWDRSADCEPAVCTNLPGRPAGVQYPLAIDDDVVVGGDQFGYDPRGNRLYQSTTLEDVTFETRTAYDNVDRVFETTMPDGTRIGHGYDGASRLASLEWMGAGELLSIEYDTRGQPGGMLYGNGVETTLTYDSRQFLSGILSVTGAGDSFQELNYLRDRDGVITAIEDSVGNAGAVLTHDAWDRLTAATLAGGTAHQETLGLTYDAIDNISSLTSDLGESSPNHVGNYTYGVRPNAATAAGGRTMTYGGGGFMATGGRNGELAYEWDYQGRLTSVRRGQEVRSRSVYGANQVRLLQLEGASVTYYPSPSFDVRDGISSTYARLNGMRAVRIDSDALATVVLTDLQGDDRIDVVDAWLAHADEADIIPLGDGEASPAGRLLAASTARMLFETQDEVAYLHRDHLGSITVATDEDGEVTGRRDFSPFGQILAESGTVDEYGFTGQEADANGLLHFGFRALDPTIGRWLSVDPLYMTSRPRAFADSGQALGAYAYVANNPANLTDPDGLRGSSRGSSRSASRAQRPGRVRRLRNRLRRRRNQPQAGERTPQEQHMEMLRAMSETSQAEISIEMSRETFDRLEANESLRVAAAGQLLRRRYNAANRHIERLQRNTPQTGDRFGMFGGLHAAGNQLELIVGGLHTRAGLSAEGVHPVAIDGEMHRYQPERLMPHLQRINRMIASSVRHAEAVHRAANTQ